MEHARMRDRRLFVLMVVLSLSAVGPGVSAAYAEQYEFVTKWGSYGGGQGQFSGPSGVAVDAVGNVYVADCSNHRVQKFTGGGAFLTKWGSYGTGNGQLRYPVGVAVDASGNVYVPDNHNHRVQKFTNDGAFLIKWGSYGSGDGQFVHPHSAAVDPAGNVYVTGPYYDRIQKFTSGGLLLTRWGSHGSGAGELTYPGGVAADFDGNIYVGDRANHRVQKFTSGGCFLTQWGSAGSGDGQFLSPTGVAVDAAGSIYVADADNNRIEKFTSSGSFLAKWGSYGSGAGQFSLPQGVAVDAAGNVYVADTLNHCIQKFRRANGPPVANAGPDQTVEADRIGAAEVALDGSGSGDPDGDPLTYAWIWTDAEGEHSETGVNPTVVLPLGETTVTLVVNDGQVASAADTVAITVEDTTPPQISDLKVTPALLWPANNKLCDVTLSYTVSDAVDPAPQAQITSVTCNEASFSSADYVITDATNLKLRAKREGSSNAGRIYTITLTATDDAGRSSESECTVCVPHDMSGKKALAATAMAVPTAGGAQIVFSLSAGAKVTARILNLAGRPVRTLCSSRAFEAGTSTVVWNAASDRGPRVPGGTYLIEISAAAADGAGVRILTQVMLDR